MGETYGLRVALRRSDGQMVTYAWDDIPRNRVGQEVENAVKVLRAFVEVSWPEEREQSDYRALFAWKHPGFGVHVPATQGDEAATAEAQG